MNSKLLNHDFLPEHVADDSSVAEPMNQ